MFTKRICIACLFMVSVIFTSGFSGQKVDQQLAQTGSLMEKILIPEGTFMMGAEYTDQKAENDEKPAHEVYLDEFRIDKTEVSNQMFVNYLNELGFSPDALSYRLDPNASGILYKNGKWTVDSEFADLPVTYVSWIGADEYCSWSGGRLPHEAEWEAAARGVSDQYYPWGDELDCNYANYEGCTDSVTPVTDFENGASEFGVLNLAGNVWEWTADYYIQDAYKHWDKYNPLNEEYNLHVNQGFTANGYVIRGGSWEDSAVMLRNSNRAFRSHLEMTANTGFRCVYTNESLSSDQSEREEKMVLIPGGEFLMGASDNDLLAEEDELHEHEVYVSPFWMDKYEVTNQAFAAFLGDEGFTSDSAHWLITENQNVIAYADGTWYVRNDQEQYPVVNVTQIGAAAFCQWLGKRLPTEAEWEFAAGGELDSVYYWGNEPNCEQANFDECDYGLLQVTDLPGSINDFGVYNMFGNVWEWTASTYTENSYEDMQYMNPELLGSASFSLHSPLPMNTGVIRGGSWQSDVSHLRITNRAVQWKLDGTDQLGFRCVLSAD